MYEYLYIYILFQVNTQSNGNTALQIACMDIYIYIYFQVNTQSNGNTALQVACMNGHTDVVLFLIGKDADLENEVTFYMYF